MFVGIDPDTTRPAFCGVSAEGEVTWLWCPKVKSCSDLLSKIHLHHEVVTSTNMIHTTDLKLKYAVIEDQYIAEINRASHIKKLGQFAGACMSVVPNHYTYDDESRVKFIAPSTWKGSIPKHIHQARILKKLGWGYIQKGGKSPYSIPKNPPKEFSHIKAGEWKHLVDAIGMALFAKEVYDFEQRTGMKKWDRLK